MDRMSELRLAADAKEVAAFLRGNGGSLISGWTVRTEPGPDDEPGVYWLKMRPKSVPQDQYVARVAWTRYPGAPPSVTFATKVRGRTDVTNAWPSVAGARPGNFDFCAAFTAEGYKTHPEWASQHPWPTTGNPFLWVVQVVQGLLDRHYSGRAA